MRAILALRMNQKNEEKYRPTKERRNYHMHVYGNSEVCYLI